MVNQITTIAATAIQAPSTNLLITTMTRTAPVTQAPMVLIARDRIIRSRAAASVVVAQQPVPVPDHAGLTARERHEHAHDVQLDQPRRRGVEGDDQHDREARTGAGCRC